MSPRVRIRFDLRCAQDELIDATKHVKFNSKFPGNPEATQAFQKVNVAYDILSTPSSKRVYDSRPASAATHDFFSARPYAHAEETFRGVILGVINDFLEGDLETVRTLLSA